MSDVSQHLALNRRTLAASAFVEILDTLVNDFDIIDVLTQLTSRCVDLLDVDAAGILLADESGRLRIVGASSERIQLLELFQLQNDQGPCLDCYTTGETIAAPDLTTETPWPKFSAESIAAGYHSVYAIPLHHNSVTLGCLNLFMSDPGPLASSDAVLAQALADVASVAIVQSHANQQIDGGDGHLHHALDSRITVEQAKGMLAEHFAVDVHDAFEMLRSHARDNNSSLTGIARQLVAGAITVVSFHRPTHTQSEVDLPIAETSLGGRQRIVRLRGEVDLATRDACFDACVNGDGDTVEVDMSAVTFMDCSGYGSLIAARLVLEQRGGSLSVSHVANQPAYLVGLLAEYENACATGIQVSRNTAAG